MATWTALFDDDFEREFAALDRDVQLAIAAYVEALTREGPRLGRPHADTLSGSKHANMKELRPTVNKIEWRVAFAFDPERKAVVLVAGAKGGEAESRFYKRLINTADLRFQRHLDTLVESANAPRGRRKRKKP
jgi:hypothetical protein